MPPGGPAAAALPAPPAPRWVESPAPDPEVVSALEASLRLPRPLCALLAVRGHGEPDRAKSFLRPLLTDLPDPRLLADAGPAVDRIGRAVESGETILVHGDYDVDGVAAAALLTRWIRSLGGTVVPFVPHRIRDGYDFGRAGLEAARSAGATLLVTADSGISAHAAVRDARDAGIDVIVTDHHTPGDTLPPALAVVNPNRSDCPYPDKGLCGAGVAFKLCQLLADRFARSQEELLPLLDLVALATVADLVPLSGENRTFVRYGLRALRSTSNPGLQALVEITGLAGRPITAGRIGFVLAPRINAVGRMDDAGRALDLLLAESPADARLLAEELERQNGIRKDEDRRTLEHALALLAEGFDPDRDYGLVLAADGWHPGVIGIVASRVVERVYRPTVLVALRDGRGRGSARSIRGFDLFSAVKACASYLDRYGGHRQAAGMDLDARLLDDFRRAFNDAARARLEAGDLLRPTIRADLELSPAEVTQDLAHYLGYLGPHGIGNPRPVFLARGVTLANPPRTVGRGHLKLRLTKDGGVLDAIGWDMADRIGQGVLGGPLDVLFHIEESEYRGVKRVDARIQDLRPSPAGG